MSSDIPAFRAEATKFLATSLDSGIACPAYGAILVPAFHDQARRWQAAAAEAGFSGIHWPTEFGGRGLGRDHSEVWREECARVGVAPYINLQGPVLTGEAILQWGTDEQKRRFLPSILTAEELWCQLFSEPDAGSDLASLKTFARRDGDRYMVSGQKVWSSNAQFAEYGILIARTSTDLPRHKGLSFFLIDMTLPGIEVRPLKQATGDSEFCEVFFDDVPMPADALLGPEHGGWAVAM